MGNSTLIALVTKIRYQACNKLVSLFNNMKDITYAEIITVFNEGQNMLPPAPQLPEGMAPCLSCGKNTRGPFCPPCHRKNLLKTPCIGCDKPCLKPFCNRECARNSGKLPRRRTTRTG